LYRLSQSRTEPLIPSERRYEVPERVDAHGPVLTPLDKAAVREAAIRMREQAVESIAIVFLWSFLYPEHEERAAAILSAELPGVPLTLSSHLLPEYREYERTATCTLNAYVAPPVSRYLTKLRERLPQHQIRVLQSSGGAIEIETAAREAARLVLSGPAGGVVGALAVARTAEAAPPRLLTFDMGGTSTDVALCDGDLPVSSENSIAGLPLRLPALDIHTVGAGGGSLAWIDDGGALRAGPQSAGASPGPACYGRGGTLPTVSDANLVLGRLDVEHFLGGRQKLDVAAARAAIAPLAAALNLTEEEAALGIIRVANAAMERALRRVSVERGVDPRGFTLFPFGGAGPLHACDLAEALGMARILVAPSPGVLSALGMLAAGEWRDFSRSLLLPLAELAPGAVEAALTTLRPDDAFEWEETHLDLRYRGQSYEITVPLEQPVSKQSLLEAATAFHLAHERRFGHANPGRAVEAVTLRLRCGRSGLPLEFPTTPPTSAPPIPAGMKTVWFETAQETPCYQRETLQTGQTFSGPAIVWQFDTTTVVSPGWRARVDERANLWLEQS
jgi:N-methylhydantoinase A